MHVKYSDEDQIIDGWEQYKIVSSLLSDDMILNRDNFFLLLIFTYFGIRSLNNINFVKKNLSQT